jgi:hypothetical protein
MVRRPRRSPTACEAGRPAFAPPQRSLVSWHSFLCAQPTAAPSPQITVLSKRPQNVVRPLHHQGSQVTVSFLADMELRLATARIPAPGTQTQITAHVAAAAKSVRVFQRQHIGQGDQRSHTFHLLEQADLGVVFLGDLLDLPVVCGDPLVQRFDLRFQGGWQFHAQARGEIRAHLLIGSWLS